MPETQDPSSQRGHVYAIDQEHRLVYIDQQARRVFPHARLGSLCYTLGTGDRHVVRCARLGPRSRRKGTRARAPFCFRARTQASASWAAAWPFGAGPYLTLARFRTRA